MILTALGWLAAAAALALAALSGWHGLTARTRDAWAATGLYACAAVIMLAIVGVLPAVTSGLLSAICALAVAAVALPAGLTPGGWDWKRAVGFVFRAARDQIPALPPRGGPSEAEASSPEAAVAEAAATRNIPNVMDDPALGAAPEPAELVSGAVPAAPPYAQLAQYIAGFEPEDDMSLRMFMEGNAAGSVMVADAWHHLGDTLLNTVGLDPAYVAGILEAGDSAGGHGSLLAQIHKRYSVIYAAVKEWVAAHGPLPHKARDFLTGE